MIYIFVKWINSEDPYPHETYHEVDAYSNEIRKIEFLRNGNLLGYASEFGEHGSSILSDQKVPSVTEINELNEFVAKEICKEDFDKIWHKVEEIN